MADQPLRTTGAFSGAVAQATAALAIIVIRITLAIVFIVRSLPIRVGLRGGTMLAKLLILSTKILPLHAKDMCSVDYCCCFATRLIAQSCRPVQY